MSSNIANFYASLGFRVDEKGLQRFQGRLRKLKQQVDGKSGLVGAFGNASMAQARFAQGAVRGLGRVDRATKAAKNSQLALNAAIQQGNILRNSSFIPTGGSAASGGAARAASQSGVVAMGGSPATGGAPKSFSQGIARDYPKVPPNLGRARSDAKRVSGDARATQAQKLEAHKRVSNKIGQLEQKAAREAQANEKRKQAALEKTRQKLGQIGKRYDSQSSKLKQARRDFSYVRAEMKRGNITQKRGSQQLDVIIRQYRRLKRAKIAAASVRDRTGAGGSPRQAGNHRLISALHSDTGLGIMAGGFAAAKSVQSYQGYKAVEQGLTGATGSKEKGQAEVEYLHELSQEMGLFMGDISQDYAKFAASARDTTIGLKEQRDTFKGVAAQVRILNLSAADSKRIFRALSQMMSSGQVMAQELKLQMGDQLPGAMRAMARAAHKTGITQDASIESMNKAMKAGKLMSEKILPAFGEEMWKAANQGGALKEAINNTGAALGRLQTNVWMTNKAFNEAGFDEGVRRLVNTLSDFFLRSETFFSILGAAAGQLVSSLRGPIELITSLTSKLNKLENSSPETAAQIKILVGVFASLFRWSRRLLIVWALILPAMSGVAKIIDGESLSWQEWTITILGSVFALGTLLEVMGKVKGAFKGSPFGGKPKIPSTTPATSTTPKTKTPSNWPSSKPGWAQGTGKFASAMGKILSGASIAASFSPAGRVVKILGGASIAASFLPDMTSGIVSEKKRTFEMLRDQMLRDDKIRRENDIPWWEGTGPKQGWDVPALRQTQTLQEKNRARQMIISGDVFFNIEGENSKEISDEVLRTIQRMTSSASVQESADER